MVKRYCDKCGKEIQGGSTPGYLIVNVVSKVIKATRHEWELCYECADKLREFIEEDENDQNN